MKPPFWKDKKVLLTGHTGFKGSWLSLWLQQLGANLTGYALQPPTSPNLFALTDVASGMTSLLGDIRDAMTMKDVVAEHQPEIVIHMAAQPLVRYSYENPIETFATNVMGTVNVLDAIRQTDSVRVVLCITTDKCYENREWEWGYREDEPMGGHDPYSASKGCAELVTAAYRRSFFTKEKEPCSSVAVASARAGNVIGGGDWAEDRLVPDILRAFIAEESCDIRNPSSMRPWQHVLEPLRGYMCLVENLWKNPVSYSSGWNFGPVENDARPVGWVVEHLADCWGAGADWKVEPGTHPHEAHYLKLDCSKARSKLGWEPRLPLERALHWTADWYRAYQRGDDLRRLTHKQIMDYEELCP